MELSRRDLRRAFRLTLIASLVFAGLVFVAAMTVPFSVHQQATITALSNDAMLIRRGGQMIPLIAGDSIGQRISSGQGIRLDDGETAALTFALNGGKVELIGPAELVLYRSYRRATTRNHLTNHASYVLTLEQKSGTARYNFASADPVFSAVEVGVRLPLTTYVPSQPCWEIIVASDGSATSRDLPCP